MILHSDYTLCNLVGWITVDDMLEMCCIIDWLLTSVLLLFYNSKLIVLKPIAFTFISQWSYIASDRWLNYNWCIAVAYMLGNCCIKNSFYINFTIVNQLHCINIKPTIAKDPSQFQTVFVVQKLWKISYWEFVV